MTLRQYLILMSLMTAACWAGWIAVVRTIDPLETGLIGLVLFYASLALSLAGTFSIAGLTARGLARRREPISRHVPASFRQGVLFSAMFVGGLALQSQALLAWWNLLSLLAVAVTVEFLMVSLGNRTH